MSSLYKGYGFTSYGCSCIGSFFIGLLVASLVVILATLIGKTSILSDFPVLFAYPVITIILWIGSMVAIWTPGDAYRLIRFIYRDYWQSGKDIWQEKK